MKKLYRRTIGALALSVLFIFPGLSAFPQETNETAAETIQAAQVQEETTASAKQQAAEGKVEFPILIGIP